MGTTPTPFLGEMYEKQGEFLDEWAKHERRPHLRGKWSIFWYGTFLSEVNHNLVVKLYTSCVQNVVTTERGGLGRARPGTDAEDSFFPGTGHTYPHLDEIHDVQSVSREFLSFCWRVFL